MFTWNRWSAQSSLIAAVIGFVLALGLHVASFFAADWSLFTMYPPAFVWVLGFFMITLSSGAAASASWKPWATPTVLPPAVAARFAWVRAHLRYGYALVIGLWLLAPLWMYLGWWSGLEPAFAHDTILWVRIISALMMGLYLWFFLDIVKRSAPARAAR